MENISQKQHGRPRTWVGEHRAQAAREYPNRSRRHLDNMNYEMRAVAVVMEDPRFEWLMSDPLTIRQGKGHMRRTILAELGRIADERSMEAMALYLCEHQPATRQAVAMIRRARLGTRPPGTSAQLADVLRHTIDTYLSEHQPLPWADIRHALYDVLDDIDATERDEQTPS